MMCVRIEQRLPSEQAGQDSRCIDESRRPRCARTRRCTEYPHCACCVSARQHVVSRKRSRLRKYIERCVSVMNMLFCLRGVGLLPRMLAAYRS